MRPRLLGRGWRSSAVSWPSAGPREFRTKPLVQRGSERCGDVRLVVLAETCVEWERERARGDVLCDRAQADAVAEALLHVRLEVDGRQVTARIVLVATGSEVPIAMAAANTDMVSIES